MLQSNFNFIKYKCIDQTMSNFGGPIFGGFDQSQKKKIEDKNTALSNPFMNMFAPNQSSDTPTAPIYKAQPSSTNAFGIHQQEKYNPSDKNQLIDSKKDEKSKQSSSFNLFVSKGDQKQTKPNITQKNPNSLFTLNNAPIRNQIIKNNVKNPFSLLSQDQRQLNTLLPNQKPMTQFPFENKDNNSKKQQKANQNNFFNMRKQGQLPISEKTSQTNLFGSTIEKKTELLPPIDEKKTSQNTIKKEGIKTGQSMFNLSSFGTQKTSENIFTSKPQSVQRVYNTQIINNVLIQGNKQSKQTIKKDIPNFQIKNNPNNSLNTIKASERFVQPLKTNIKIDKSIEEQIKQDIQIGRKLTSKQKIKDLLIIQKKQIKNNIVELLKYQKQNIILNSRCQNHAQIAKKRISLIKTNNATLQLLRNKLLDDINTLDQKKDIEQKIQINYDIQTPSFGSINPSMKPEDYLKYCGKIVPPHQFLNLHETLVKFDSQIQQLQKDVVVLQKSCQNSQIIFRKRKNQLYNIGRQVIDIFEDEQFKNYCFKYLGQIKQNLLQKYKQLKQQIRQLRKNKQAKSRISMNSMIY